MTIFFKNGSYIKTIPMSGETKRSPRTKVYLLKEGYKMTNLQKMFKGDLTAADKWAAEVVSHSICGSCQIRTYCDTWNAGVYRDNMTCMAAHIRWLLEEAVDEPVFKEVSKPVQAVQVHMMCQCGGEFRDTGGGLGSVTEGKWSCYYQHKCDKCGAVQDFDRIYPYIKYEEVELND